MLRLLLVSDTHLAWKFIDEAAKLAKSHDVIICSGDLGVYNDETKKVSDLEAQSDMDRVLRRLEHGHDKPVYFLPGNHDAPSSFSSSLKLGSRAVNVHNLQCTLVPGLVLIGFGGAVPAYQNGYICWAGFPFTDHGMGEKLEKLWSQPRSPDDQVILITHCGPAEVLWSFFVCLFFVCLFVWFFFFFL